MKRDYLSRLARAARWYLPPAEAAEVLEDYQEIVEAEPRTEDELRRHIGAPKDAVGQLVQLRAYHRWLMVFAVLVVCVLLPAVGPVWQRLTWRTGIYTVVRLDWVFSILGTALSFLWFQRNGRREGPPPKGIFPVMLIPLAGMVWTWFVALLAMYRLEPMMQFLVEHPGTGPLIHDTLVFGGLVMGFLGFFGLVKARLSDRRWRAVYVWGLAGAVLCFSVWALLSSIALPATVENWQTPYFMRYIFITLAGLAGTAVSLC